jgi:membrane-associated phospholipid phosphatase
VKTSTALCLAGALAAGCAGAVPRQAGAPGAESPPASPAGRPEEKTPSAPERPAAGTPSERGRIEEGLFNLDYPTLLLRDAEQTVTAPARWDGTDWLTFGLEGAAVMGTAAFLDKPVKKFVDRNRSPGWDRVAKHLSPQSVEYYSVCSLAGFYLAGLALDDRQARIVGEDGLAGCLLSGAIAQALKWTVGRARPNEDKGPYSFTPFHGDHSFPSGHATQSFTAASVITSHYDSVWVGVISYGTATAIGLSRIEKDAHWTSDVLAGAFLGIGIGKALVGWNALERGDVTIEPVAGRGEGGIEVTIRF